MSLADLADLHEKAGELHVVVVGAGAAGLVAAREITKVGMQVTVVEASDQVGGAIRTGEVAGLELDLGAESFATRGGHVASLIDELGFSDDVVSPNSAGAWVAGVPGVGAAPLPKGGVLGIPANPFGEDVRRVIGWRGAWRAYIDRVRPPLTIGHAHSLGVLVRSRMGQRVLDRLVAPVTSGVYSASPDDIDPDIAAPGLNTALTRTGSLSGAVAELSEKRSSAPGGAVKGLRGGMGSLARALAADIEDRGGDVRLGASVVEIEREAPEADRAWCVVLDEVGDDDEQVELLADAVIIATEERPARALLSPVVGSALAAEPPVAGPVVSIATLVVESPELDAAPRGTGVLTVPGSHRAKALTHASAKWQWVADAAGSGTHVVRVSFGSAGAAPVIDGLAPEAQAELAREEASALLGVSIDAASVREVRVERFQQSQPAATTGHRQQTAAARTAIRGVAEIGAVGAWLSGTGLAQVIPDAINEADRVRRALLFDAH